MREILNLLIFIFWTSLGFFITSASLRFLNVLPEQNFILYSIAMISGLIFILSYLEIRRRYTKYGEGPGGVIY